MLALLALVATGAQPISAQNSGAQNSGQATSTPAAQNPPQGIQVTSTPQGGFTLKANAELVLTNIVARDAKTGELITGPEAERLQDLRERQGAEDRHLRL